MTIKNQNKAEKIAEQYAVYFMQGHLGNEFFLGSTIEQILAEKAFIIYQNVDDLSYFGAAIHLLDKHLIAINTAQTLRLRYYSAAHELWHLQFESGDIPLADFNNFDHERAADHFAVSIMLPEGLVRTLCYNLDDPIEQLIIKIADFSAMPYEAVARRMKEIGQKIPKAIIERTEEDWRLLRQALGFPPSPLDRPNPFEQFSAFSKEIQKQVDSNQLTLEMAANLSKHIDPKQAASYWNQRQRLIDDWDSDD